MSPTRIELNWRDNATNETGYKIERRRGLRGSWMQIAMLPANSTNYIDSALASDTTYVYRLRAFNDAAHSRYSAEIGAITAKHSLQWSTATPSPTPRAEAAGVAADNRLYVAGGFVTGDMQVTRRFEVYDPLHNTWSVLRNMPVAQSHGSAAVDGTTLYFAGLILGHGEGDPSHLVYRYDTLTDTWSRGPSLPENVGAGALVRRGRYLHFFGGLHPDGTDSPSHWTLYLGRTSAIDDDARSWQPKAPLLNARNHLAGVTVGDLVYAIGGQHGTQESTARADVHTYNAATDTWSAVASLPHGLHHIGSAAFELNGRIVVVAGEDATLSNTSNVYQYDPSANSWIALPPLPVAKKSVVARAINNRVIVTTGNNPLPSTTTYTATFAENWEIGPSMPVVAGEVAGGIIGNRMYLVGSGTARTVMYDLTTRTWRTNLAQRPLRDDHHAAEVFDHKLYLLGGLGASAGKVQIYDPNTNAWTFGADMPFDAGSSATALIDGFIYVAGGIVGSSATNHTGTGTTAQAARYNPTANTWQMINSMPQGVNHAAAATDGRRLWVFGGRGGVNQTTNGFNTVQVYDTVTGTWNSSLTSGIAPLPQARGGTGKAVYHNGEFYVFGGETNTGPGATIHKTYNRTDIYNPETNTWRLGSAMPTARHGIFPMLHQNRVYIAGGGPRAMQAGFNDSNILEIMHLL